MTSVFLFLALCIPNGKEPCDYTAHDMGTDRRCQIERQKMIDTQPGLGREKSICYEVTKDEGHTLQQVADHLAKHLTKRSEERWWKGE